MINLKTLGGLESISGYRSKTHTSSPPELKSIWRPSMSYKHRHRARWKFGTSKDVMPAKAGYTSIPSVYKKSIYEVSDLLTICACAREQQRFLGCPPKNPKKV